MKKFILIDHEPWTLNSQTGFLKQFEDAGINIIVWNFSQYIHPGYHMPNEIDLPIGGKYINNFSEFVSAFNEELKGNEIVIIECIPRDWKTRQIFKLLSKHHIPTVRIESYANTPTVKGSKNLINKLLTKDCLRLALRKIKYIGFKLYCKLYKIEGQTIMMSSNSTIKRTHFLNHPDYEKYRFGNWEPIIQGRYIVFSDVYFPLHPDLVFQYEAKNKVDEKKYYQQMCNLFEYIENKYNLPVVIAAHPKSFYKGDEFNGRKIIKDQTNILIANSEAVIFHYSCTLSYVALFNKPIAFVHSSLFERFTFLKNTVQELAKSLNLPYYKIDDNSVPEIRFLRIGEVIRRNYIYSYLTTEETKDIHNSEIIKKALLSI